jgi:hypothetical protein
VGYPNADEWVAGKFDGLVLDSLSQEDAGAAIRELSNMANGRNGREVRN